MALSHGRVADAAAYNIASPVIYALWWFLTGAMLVGAVRASSERRRWAPRGSG